MQTRKVPELSLLSFVRGEANERARFVDALFRGLKEYGFITLSDHTVDPAKVERAYDLTHELFALPEIIKRNYMNQEGGTQRGYTPFGQEHAKYSQYPDLKEFWHVGRELDREDPQSKWLFQYYPDNIWPRELLDFKQCMLELYSSLDMTAKLILSALAQALELPTDYFHKMVHNGNCILRLIHYPPLGREVDPHCVRAAAHEDINLITLLMGATDSGLELLDRNGEWLAVETPPGHLIIDSGDMMSRITNDVIPATTHRVVNPKDHSSARYSMPFFVQPHPEIELSCISSCEGEGSKYPPISSHEFMLERLRAIGMIK